MSRPDGFRGLVDRRTLSQIVLGFLVAGIVLWLLAVGVGTKDLRRILAAADLRWVALGCLSTAVCLALWAKAWEVVLGVVGVEAGYRRLVTTYFAATFTNYVTPLGQAGGEPFIAYVLARDTEASYEDSLAAVVTADLLNLFPFFTFAGLGFAGLLWAAALPSAVRPLALGLAAMAIGVPLLAGLSWNYRFRLGRLVLRIARPIARFTPRFTVEGLRERFRDLNEAFERIADEPRALAFALIFSYLGWVAFAFPLYFAGLALGHEIAPWLVLFIVPASTLAGLVPSPGGLGGVEAALLALLVALVGMGQASAFATALLYRVESYWFAILLGGLASMQIIRRN